MTTKIEDRDTAARHIDATEIAPDVWVYLPSEVNRHYTVTSEDLATLGRDLRVGAPDAYSLWCSVCGDESTDDEIAEYTGTHGGIMKLKFPPGTTFVDEPINELTGEKNPYHGMAVYIRSVHTGGAVWHREATCTPVCSEDEFIARTGMTFSDIRDMDSEGDLTLGFNADNLIRSDIVLWFDDEPTTVGEMLAANPDDDEVLDSIIGLVSGATPSVELGGGAGASFTLTTFRNDARLRPTKDYRRGRLVGPIDRSSDAASFYGALLDRPVGVEFDVEIDRRQPVPKPDMDADLRTGLVEFTIEIDRRQQQ